jgi:hypothetical protein
MFPASPNLRVSNGLGPQLCPRERWRSIVCLRERQSAGMGRWWDVNQSDTFGWGELFCTRAGLSKSSRVSFTLLPPACSVFCSSRETFPFPFSTRRKKNSCLITGLIDRIYHIHRRMNDSALDYLLNDRIFSNRSSLPANQLINLFFPLISYITRSVRGLLHTYVERKNKRGSIRNQKKSEIIKGDRWWIYLSLSHASEKASDPESQSSEQVYIAG